MGFKEIAYKVYSAVAIAIFGSGYVLANYFPETAEKIGLGWLNSHKQTRVETAAWSCDLSWDWGAGTAVAASRVDYQLHCQAKQAMTLEDFVIYISEHTRYNNASGPGGQARSHGGSEQLGSAGRVNLQAGQNFSKKGTLGIPFSSRGDKNSSVQRKLILSARVSYASAPPPFPEGQDPHQLFVYTGVY